jgi:hypothetical protein
MDQHQQMQPQQNPYDFILKDKPKKRFPFSLPNLPGGGKSKILYIAIAAGIFFIILLVVIGSFLSGGNSTKIYEIAAAQQDLIELTTNTELKDQALINSASTVNLVVTTHFQELQEYMSNKGVSNLSKKATPYRNTNFKESLEKAASSGTYDETFKALLANQTDAYRVKLQAAYGDIKSQDFKNLLASEYAELSTLSTSSD